MRFPLIEHVALPVTFERFVQGQLHRDGRRYLPQLIFKLANSMRLGVVDRHHYVDPQLEGRHGIARLVLLLGDIRLQPAGEQRQGIVALADERSAIITAPAAYGQVVAVPAWEMKRGQLPYEQLYAELLLDIGAGVVGVRTSITADDLAQKIGAAQIQVGDWLHVVRAPRIDVLAFEPAQSLQPGSTT